MKKFFLSIIIAFLALNVFSQDINIVLDERIELMGVILRLSDAEEYLYDDIAIYSDAEIKYFEEYKNHPLVDYTKKLKNNKGFTCDDFMEIIVSSEIVKGKIRLRKNINISNFNKNWNNTDITRYVSLLNKFYRETHFKSFFESNDMKQIRKIAEENFSNSVTDKIDFDWFKKFFGFLPDKKNRIILSLSNRRNNFVLEIVNNNGSKEFYAVIGSWMKDKKGFPVYDDNRNGSVVRRVVVRNICISFCNDIVEEYKNELLPNAVVFYNLIKGGQQKPPYDTPVEFLNQILSRAFYIQYCKDTKELIYSEEYEIAKEIDKGFIYMPELINALEQYNADRITYNTFKDFVPEIVKVHNALDPQQKYNDVEEQKPIMLGTNIENNSYDINHNIERITLRFNRPMDVRCCGIINGNEVTPEFINSEWNEEGTEWTIFVKLNPDTKYQIVYPQIFFMDSKTLLCPKETYILTFTTQKGE